MPVVTMTVVMCAVWAETRLLLLLKAAVACLYSESLQFSTHSADTFHSQKVEVFLRLA